MSDGAVQIWEGKVLRDDGKVAAAEACCCECDCCDCSDVEVTITVTGGNANLVADLTLTDEDVLDDGPTGNYECDYDVGDEIMDHAAASWPVHFYFDEEACEWAVEVDAALEGATAGVWDLSPLSDTISGADCFPVSFQTTATKPGEPDATITITLDGND